MDTIRKGDIFYVYKDKPPIYYTYKYPKGTPMITGTPAIVISGEETNKQKNVNVVFLTLTQRDYLPTHVPIASVGRGSVALCEKIHTIHKEKLGDFITSCSMEEIQEIDNAIRFSLELEDNTTSDLIAIQDALTKAEAEKETYKTLYEELLNQASSIEKSRKKKRFFFF